MTKLREALDESAQRFSQAETAQRIGISTSLLSKWKREELLVPSLGTERDLRTRGREMRGYTLRDVVAGLFAKVALEDLHFRGEALREMVSVVQRADEDELRHAVILTARTYPGLMKHAWIPDVRPPLTNGPEMFDLEDYEYTNGEALIDELKRRGKYISSGSMKECVDAILLQVEKRLEQDKLAATTNEAC